MYDSYQKSYEATPKGAFIRQRANARRRGVEWKLTFEQWWSIWESSGKWQQRGKSAESYCMSRKFDWGPYSQENVVITTMSKNSKHAAKRVFSNKPM